MNKDYITIGMFVLVFIFFIVGTILMIICDTNLLKKYNCEEYSSGIYRIDPFTGRWEKEMLHDPIKCANKASNNPNRTSFDNLCIKCILM